MTAAAADLAAASLAPATRRAYRAALERLDSWRAGHNRPLNAFDEPSGTSDPGNGESALYGLPGGSDGDRGNFACVP